MKNIDPSMLPSHGFFTSINPAEVMYLLKAQLQTAQISFTEAPDSWKLNFDVVKETRAEETTAQDAATQEEDKNNSDEDNNNAGAAGNDQPVIELNLKEMSKVQVSIKQNPENDSVFFAEFKRKGGSTLLFLDQVTKLRNAVIAPSAQ